MDFNSYEELEKEINRLITNKNSLNNVSLQLDSNNISPAEKESNKRKISNNISEIDSKLLTLYEIQNAYNKYINYVKEIQKLDVIKTNQSDYDYKVKDLREKIELEKKKLPPVLLNRALEEEKDILLNNNEVNSNIQKELEEYNKLYEEIEKEINDFFEGRELDEIGYNEFDDFENKFHDILDKKNDLLREVKGYENTAFSDNVNELVKKDEELKDKLEVTYKGMTINKDIKEDDKKRIEQAIIDKTEEIKKINKEIKEIKDKINNSSTLGLSDEEVNKLKTSLTDLTKKKQDINDLLLKLNSNYNIVLKGGKVDRDFIDGLSPVKKPKSSKSSTKKPRGKGKKPITKTEKPATLKELIKSGVLPKSIPEDMLLQICDELNIKGININTPLTPEQVDRLKEDLDIQKAQLNEQIIDRNKKKIEEYNELISKYESILNDKMKTGSFSPEYIKKVEKLIEKTKEKKDKLVLMTDNIIEYNYKEILTGMSALREIRLDARAISKNEKLKRKYKKLDDLRSNKYNSKFLTRINDWRIKRVLSKIEKLRQKKGKITAKQTQIINANSEKYIEKVSKKLAKFLKTQNRIEASVDKINEISKRIEENRIERERIAQDRQADDLSIFDRIALAIESNKLRAKNKGLESQRDLEDFVSRIR